MGGVESPLKRQASIQKEVVIDDAELITIHHSMMLVYGWIPLEEFKALPLPTLFGLVPKVNEEIYKREQARLVFLKFAGVKNPK